MKKRQRQPGLGATDPNVARALNILLVGYESLINTIKKNEWEPVGDDGQYTTYKCKFCGVFCLSLSTPLHRPTCPIWGHMQTHDAAIAAVIPLLRSVVLSEGDPAEEAADAPTKPSSASSSAEFVRVHTSSSQTPHSASSSSSSSSSTPSSSSAAAASAAAMFARASNAAEQPQKFPPPSENFPPALGGFGGNFEGSLLNPFALELGDMDDLGNLFGGGAHLPPLTCAQERALEENEEGFQFMDQFFTEAAQMRSLGGRVTAEAIRAAQLASSASPSQQKDIASACSTTNTSCSTITCTSISTITTTISTITNTSCSSCSSSCSSSSPSSSPSSSSSSSLTRLSPSRSVHPSLLLPRGPFSALAPLPSSSSSLTSSSLASPLSPSHPLHPAHPSHRPHVVPQTLSSPAGEVWRVMEQLKLERRMVDLSDDSESDEGDEGDEDEEASA